MNPFSKIKKLSKTNPLLASAINLMFSAGVTALFGFVFWIIVARHFNTGVVGLATALLSMSGIISLLGLAGFDTVFVRYLPKSKQRNEQINGGFLLSGIATGTIALLFCVLIPVIVPKLSFVSHNIIYVLLFVVFTVLTTMNTLTNAVLVAYRKSSFVVVINIIFSFVKMVLPFLFVGGGPIVIFVFMGIAQTVNVTLSIAAMMKYCNYVPSFKINLAVIKETRQYGLASYASNILNLLPDSALPLIVINMLGSKASAYFFIAFTIANLLYTIAFATNQAGLAESSYDEENMLTHTVKGLRFTTILLVPASIFIIVACPFILHLFGKSYSNGAVELLRILCLSSLPVMLYSTFGYIFKHLKYMRSLILMSLLNAVVIIVLSIIFTKLYGLNGIGWAWLAGNIAAVIFGAFTLRSTLLRFITKKLGRYA